MRESPRIRRLRSDLKALEQLKADSTLFDYKAYGDPPHTRYMCMRSFAHYGRHPDQPIEKWREWTGYDEGTKCEFVIDLSSGPDKDQSKDLTVLMVKPHA